MNDKISPDVNHQTDEQEDFDPLAELARIVAGEVEDAEKEHQSNDPIEPDEKNLVSDDLEAELMRELREAEVEPSESDASLDEPVNEPENLSAEIDTINQIDASLDGIDNPNQGTNEETNSEGDFQNDLIDALQNELDEPRATDEPADTTATDTHEVDQSMATTELEDTTAIRTTEEIAHVELEESIEIETAAIDEKVEEVESFSLEEEMAQIVEEETRSPQSITQTSGIDSEEDLGKAFLDELESRVGIVPAPEKIQVEEVSIDPVVSPQTQFSTEPQIDTTIHAEPQLGDEQQANGDLELDFEQAFSHELGLGTSLEEDIAEAPAMVAASALDTELEDQINTTNDELNLDPGHSGQIPEVTADATDAPVSGMKYAVVAIFVALLAGAGVAAYGFYGEGSSLMTSDIPVIEAEKTAYKVKPKDPGGKVVNNQDNATYAEVEGVKNGSEGQKSLVSNLEEPAVIDQSKLGNEAKDTDRLINTQQNESAGATQNAVVKPRVVKIQTVKPDGTIVATSPVSAAASKVEEQMKVASNQAKDLATEVKTVATKVIAPLKPLDGAKTSNQIVSPTASPKEKPAAEAKKVKVAVPQKKPAKPAVKTQVAKVAEPAAQPKPKPVAASPASTWVVQVSSSPSQQEAQTSYNRMARKYPVIQGRSTNIVSAQVNGRTYYRLRLNTNSKADAANLCSQLKSSGGDCFITR